MNKRIIGIASTIILLMLFTGIHYSHILSAPNDYIFAENGDGIKNYYAFAYHIEHDTSMFHFQGMNHPYGDHISFTDGNPVLANSLKMLKGIFASISDHAIGIYNLTMILSFLLGGIFISLILSELKVYGLMNGLFSMAIIALNPQTQRLTGHFTLSYSWVIPMAILMYLLIHRWQSIKALSVFSVALIFLCFFVHPYLGFIASTMLLIPSILEMILDPFRRNKRALICMAVGLVPIFLYWLFMKLSDPTEGRSTLPWGFYEFYAEFETIFLPHSGPLHKGLISLSKMAGISFPEQTWDGLAYIGLSSVLILLWAALRFFRRMIPKAPVHWIALMIASALLLVLSFCIPFRWGGMFNVLAEHMGPLRQFRGLGRFAWPFYYVITISTLVYVFRQTINWKGIYRFALPILAAALMIIESWEEHQNVSASISNQGNPFKNYEPVIPEGFEKAQAILTLPYFLIGSDYYIKETHSGIDRESMLLSYLTGLPLMSSMMTRTSIPQTLNQVEFYEPNFKPKKIGGQLENAPLLVLADSSSCSEREKIILDKAEHLGAYLEHDLLLLNYSEMFGDRSKKTTDEFANRWPSSLDGLYFEDSTATVINRLLGPEEKMTFLRADIHELLSVEAGQLKNDIDYNLSVWVKGDGNSNEGILVVSEEDPETGQKDWTYINGINRFIAIEDEWMLANIDFRCQKGGVMEFLFMGPWHARDELEITQLLIRPKDEEVFQKSGESLRRNNIKVHASE